MSRSSDQPEPREDLRARILGFGERSQRKTYYPELRQKLVELERFRQLLDHAHDAILCAELPGGRLLDVNEAASRLLGHPRDALLARPLSEVLPAEVWSRLESLARPDAPRQTLMEVDLVRPDGTRIPVEMTLGRHQLGHVPYLVVVVRDIADRLEADRQRQHLEHRLRQAEKLESLGTLAGGIAHDFNNILASLMGYAELAQEDLPADADQIRGYLDGVQRAGQRATALVQQILTLARRHDPNTQAVRLQDLVGETAGLLRSSLPATIAIELDLDQDCPPVLADPAQLHQVVMNLATNAFHAMRDHGGVLGVKLATRINPTGTDDEPGPGCWAELAVHDSGGGMTPAVLARACEPYFTTKAVGEGTGLGLSTVHGIVTSCGGKLQVHSRPGEGTTVTVYLPAAAEELAGEPAPADPDLHTGRGEHVLVVDDEVEIVRFLDALLTRQGYRVTTAATPDQALAAFAEHRQSIGLVICDQTMPGRTGLELAGELRQLCPGLPVILCSGHTDDAFETRVRTAGIDAFLLKPVPANELLREVRVLLDRI